jgi:hypothetical protein
VAPAVRAAKVERAASAVQGALGAPAGRAALEVRAALGARAALRRLRQMTNQTKQIPMIIRIKQTVAKKADLFLKSITK